MAHGSFLCVRLSIGFTFYVGQFIFDANVTTYLLTQLFIFCLKQSEKENSGLQTSFGAVAPPSESSMKSSKQLPAPPPTPMSLPDFALEISRTSDDDSSVSQETKELPLPYPSGDTTTSKEDEVKNSNLLSVEQPMTSVVCALNV